MKFLNSLKVIPAVIISCYSYYHMLLAKKPE